MQRALLPILAIVAATSCHSGASGTEVLMSFARTTGLYDAPFPSDDLRTADGHIDVSAFPNPDNIALIAQALAMIAADAHGFATTSSILIPLSGALDPAMLPDLAGSITADATVFLVDVTPNAPDFLLRRPIQVAFMADGGPFGAPNLLSLLPLQGVPLRPQSTYAAVVLTSALDADDHELAVAPAIRTLAANGAPAGLTGDALASYQQALAAVTQLGIATDDLAGLAVFTTDDPTAELARFRDDALAQPLPTPSTPLVLTDTFPTYCAYAATIPMPDYQAGTPPFATAGGGWTYDASGNPALQRMEPATLVVTVPRTPMPAAGFPMTVFVRAGGGGDRPLVDRGQAATNGGPAIVPGSGPAQFFAQAGFAGASVDGPLEGLRNTTQGNEDFLIFNFNNAVALRDNLRETAMELSVFERVVEQLSFDASDCPGVGATPVHFDAQHVALMGHSIGGTVAPLVLELEPRYGVGLLSGAGGSWINNVLDKQQPVDILPLAVVLLGYLHIERALTANDPAMMIVQWAAEPADPPVYTRAIVEAPATGAAPRDILMMQGIVDHYILPDIANSTSLSLGLDLAGTELDASSAELTSLMATPLSSVIAYGGGTSIALPASGNRTIGGTTVTAVVTQHPSDGLEDGHEIVFQTDAPKHEYVCFLASWLAGRVPTVPTDDAADAPCP